MICSQYNRLLTLEYLQTENENKYFDRKSGKIKPSDLSKHISAFANADGGAIVIGLDDNKAVEGINQFGEKKINDFINAPRNYCRPMPRYEYELIDVTNSKGEPDRILLLHISESVDQIIRTSNDLTYLTQYTGKSSGTITTRLNKLIERGLVKANGNQYDPNRYYEVILS